MASVTQLGETSCKVAKTASGGLEEHSWSTHANCMNRTRKFTHTARTEVRC